jgi:hypothetical protein
MGQRQKKAIKVASYAHCKAGNPREQRKSIRNPLPPASGGRPDLRVLLKNTGIGLAGTLVPVLTFVKSTRAFSPHAMLFDFQHTFKSFIG